MGLQTKKSNKQENTKRRENQKHTEVVVIERLNHLQWTE